MLPARRGAGKSAREHSLDLTWSDEDQQFQALVRSFLTENLTPELRRAGSLMTSVYSDYETAMAWQRILQARGWAAPAWPVAYGGCGWSAVQRFIFASETAA